MSIFPNDDAIICPVGAILLEQKDEWAVQRARYMTLETMSQMSDDPLVSLPAGPADHPGPSRKSSGTKAVSCTTKWDTIT